MKFHDALVRDYWSLMPWRLHGLIHTVRRHVWKTPPCDIPDLGQLDIRPDDVVLEAGTNIGGLTRFLSTRGRLVYTFEPNRKAIEFAQRHMKDFHNVLFHNVAISDRNGAAAFNFASDFEGGNSLLLPKDSMRGHGMKYARRLAVRTQTIDSYVDSAQVAPTVWVLDCEGSEIQALKGGAAHLPDRVYLECHDIVQPDGSVKETRYECEAFLRSHGYRIDSFLDRGGYVWLAGTRARAERCREKH